MNDASSQGTMIPPEVYDIAFGWDPHPEIRRLLFLSGQAGRSPRSALELGCGTGRLLHALRAHVPALVGLELSPDMATFARARLRASWPEDPPCVLHADMSDFALGQTFDLIYASANTLRCVTSRRAIARMWACIGRHLRPGGLFIADLEVGWATATSSLHQPAVWTLSRGAEAVRATWTVVAPPTEATRCCLVEWAFELRRQQRRQTWRETFPLRVYEPSELIDLATRHGGLTLTGFHLPREPYLFELAPERAAGRVLAVFRRHPPPTR